MKKILIFGGTGFVGTQVCEKLNQASCRVTVATRRREHARHLQLLPLVDVVEIDLNDSAALAALVAGHDAVVNLIAILHGSEEAFQKVHVQWPLNLIRACKAAGVRRLVHISALGAAIDSASKYKRSKARGEAALLGAGLDVTALRPSVIFGAGDSFLAVLLTDLLRQSQPAGAGSFAQCVETLSDTACQKALHHALASASLCVIEQGCVPPGWEAAVDWAQKHPAQTA